MTMSKDEKYERDQIEQRARLLKHLQDLETYRTPLEIRFHAETGDGHLLSIGLKEATVRLEDVPDKTLWLNLRAKIQRALDEYELAIRKELGLSATTKAVE